MVQMPNRILLLLLTACLCALPEAGAQPAPPMVHFATDAFERTRLHRWLFGRNWRREWAAAVEVPSVRLDTLLGGLTPYQRSGSGESRSLRLRSAKGHEWVLRSVQKWRSDRLPPLLRNSAYGSLVQDGVSQSHPYAALALPGMLQAAGILHSRPRLVHLPQQAALDSFNATYAGQVYLLEERPAGNWSSAAHLGGFPRYLSTPEVQEHLRRNSRLKPDQHAFIRARLFDVLISDVDRHEGNWRWGLRDSGTLRYHPLPVDRDQAFYYHDGLLTPLSVYATRRRRLQRFGYRVRKVVSLTSHDSRLDRFFSNELTAADWQEAARSLQTALTDSVIRTSVQELPPPVFALSGEEIIRRLQQRRDQLPRLAARFYAALARRVEVSGSAEAERFAVEPLPDGSVRVTVTPLDGKGTAAVYQRVFRPKETRRISLRGGGGADVFEGRGKVGGIRVKSRFF